MFTIKKSNIILIIAIIISFIYLYLGAFSGINIYDEGNGLVGSLRVLNGEMPIKDFWTLYAPGWYYLLAAIQGVFGSNLETIRIFSILLMIALALLTSYLAKNIYKDRYYYIIFPIIIILAGHFTFYARALPIGIISIFISAYMIFKYFEHRNKSYIIFSGIALGLAAYFRHEMAGYIYGAEFWAIFFSSMPAKENETHTFKQRIIIGFGHGVLFTLAAVITFTPLALLLLSNIEFAKLVDSLVLFPIKEFGSYRALAFPNPLHFSSLKSLIPILWESTIFYLPFAIILFTAIQMYKRVRRKELKVNGPIFWKKMLIINLGLNFYNQALVRSDAEHAFAVLICTLILLIDLFVYSKRYSFRNIFIVVVLFFVISLPIAKKISSIKSYFSEDTEFVKSDNASKLRINKEEAKAINNINEYLKNNLSKDSKIFIGTYDNDLLYINDIALYYLLDRLPATYYHEMHPGAANTDNAQQQIVKELKSNSVDYIILRKIDNPMENNKSAISTNLNILDNYIDNTYTPIIEIGNYKLLKINL